MLRARPYAIALCLFAIAGLGHLTRQLAQILEGWQRRCHRLVEPPRAKRVEQQAEATADLGLGHPDHPVRRPVVTLERLDLADQGAVRHQLAKHWLATAGVAAFSGWFSKRRPG
jgi:hypothetical protein